MFDFLINLAKALNPRISDTPEQQFAWRQTVAVTLVLLSLLSIFNVTQANGWLRWIGVDGFVTEASLGASEQLARETREDQLIQQILDGTRRYCQAYEARDNQGMTFAFQSLQVSRSKYYILTKREYPQLQCSSSAQPSIPTQ